MSAAPQLDDGHAAVSASAWQASQQDLAQRLRQAGTRRLATLLDNSPAWVALDRACAAAGLVHVPLPLFFTPAQIQHALQAAGVDTLVVAEALAPRFAPLPARPLAMLGQALAWLRLPAVPTALPAGTAKITFTSGTTGAPKGVCLSAAGLQQVAEGVRSTLAPLQISHHLCALPLAVLLENVAGLDAALAQGLRCSLPPLAELGLGGASSFDASRFQARVAALQPNSLILLPQMLRAWTAHLAATGQRAPASLRFVAVGGAAVGAPLLQAARAQGIPAYEGYGLSEGGSVQTLNVSGHDQPGSAGRALPHARLRVNAQGEIEVGGSLFLGYLGESSPPPEWWPSGDLGRIDEHGQVWIQGRRKHVLITSFGRNISPEWVETTLRQQPALAQAVVLGDGQPALSAVLWPATPEADDATLQAAVDHANRDLPDYARVQRWVRAAAPFNADSGLATANGRPQRGAIAERHALALGLDPVAAPFPASASDPSSSTPSPTMSFHTQLLAATAEARQTLVAAPIIQGCLRGEVSLPSYLAFLQEAYHHVRHTVPLLQACQAALPDRLSWLHPALDEYIAEEAGHDEWILNDIRACGGDAEAVRHGRPGHATEVMVAYAYDTIMRGNPLGFFGMVHVLEGTSVALALMAADAIQKPLGLPDAAFSYLRSHGTLDQAHTAHFALLMDDIVEPQDQAAIVHAARAFFRLYGDVFRGLPLPLAASTGSAPAAAAANHPQPVEALA